MLTVDCLYATVSSGGTPYPIYVGFMAAEDISRIAEAPSFKRTTPHQQIATNVASMPVRDWQRPLDAGRVDAIAETYNDTGSIMPNPVLLGQNAFVSNAIEILPKTAANSPVLTGTYLVKIDDANLQDGQKPLWILDGQHRIAGMSKSMQRNNAIPVVLLLDGGANAYTSPLLAGLFAQVTTSATKLDDLHNEWLTFAFRLDRYTSANLNAPNALRSFEAVAALCRTPSYQGHANPFSNAVQFNEYMDIKPAHGGFSYKCTALRELLYKYYYNQPSRSGLHIDPSDLAQEIAQSYLALYALIGNQADTVFFGPQTKQQTIMQDAFLIGVCARLLSKGTPADWASILKLLKFHQTNWNFSWIRGLSGPANTTSKKIAIRVMSDALATSDLPSGSSTIADHLRGNGAVLTVTFSALSAAGRPIRSGRFVHDVLRGSTGSQPAHQHPHLKVTSQSSNIGKLEVVDATTRGRPIYYSEISGRGLVLTSELPKPLELMFIMSHYGDLHSQAELQINW